MTMPDNQLLETIRAGITPIHRAGWPFIAAFAAASFILGQIWEPLGWIGFVLTAWCLYFFRDPARVTPIREGLMVSPADGIVQAITRVTPPTDLQLGADERTRISIFLNVFNVHVNRIPHGGSITRAHYIPGKFVNAALDKASEDNERQLLKITMPDGKAYGVVQIAGLVARRILCDVKEGQTVKSGERFGLIRFGSRLDIYLPLDATPMVIEGQVAIGGETVIADLKSEEPQRVGTKH